MTATLTRTLEEAAAHARMIALAFGALMAMSLSTLLVRFVLTDRLYPLYGTLFSLQALYLAYFSGQGFHWPVLSWARPFASYAWNVPVAISGRPRRCSCASSPTCDSSRPASTVPSAGSRSPSSCSPQRTCCA